VDKAIFVQIGNFEATSSAVGRLCSCAWYRAVGGKAVFRKVECFVKIGVDTNSIIAHNNYIIIPIAVKVTPRPDSIAVVKV